MKAGPARLPNDTGGRAYAPGPAGLDPADTASAILTIDLGALAANYRRLRSLSRPAECAAVVKADAYGLGLSRVAPVLWREGARSFFVATLAEAVALRALLPEAVIYVFDGLLPGTGPAFADQALRPVLNSLAELREWAGFCADRGEPFPAAMHIDTGMNRLGLSEAEVSAAAAEPSLFEAFELALVISHLACADDPSHSKNEAQRATFEARRRALPAAPGSLANSGGVLLGEAFHFDLVRPGIALYGGQPCKGLDADIRPVVHLLGRILQIREAAAGETVGYGATRTLETPARIATIACGYADGLCWRLSAGDAVEGLSVQLGPYPAAILGRVSMDLITVDVTDIPENHAVRGGFAELIGPNCPIETVARHAGTVNYEVLTNLCRRAHRQYVGD